MENENHFTPKLGEKQKVLGWVVALLGIGALGYGLYHLLPYAIKIITNLWIFGALAGSLAIVVYVIFSNREFISILYKFFIDMMWRSLVNSNPIRIMKMKITELEENHGQMNQNIKNLGAVSVNLKLVIEERSAGAKEHMKIAQKAQEKENPGLARARAAMAKLRLDSIESLVPRYKAVENAYKVLSKIYEYLGYDIEKLRDQVFIKEQDLKAVRETDSALGAARSLWFGNPNKRALFDMANEAYLEQVSTHVANINRFMQQADPILRAKNIEMAILSDEGAKLLETYEQDSFADRLSFEKLIANSQDSNNEIFLIPDKSLGEEPVPTSGNT